MATASRRSDPSSYKGAELYRRLQRHLATERQLQENCYPRPSEDASDKAKYFKTRNQSSVPMKDNERRCRRCCENYSLAEDGSGRSQGECFYHLTNAFKKRYSPHAIYDCCRKREGAKGCEMAPSHVNDKNKYADLTGYFKTRPAAESDQRNTKVLSIDCEMLFTTVGMELARVTVIGDEKQVVFESLVKPDTEIIDYNTRYSGITESDMRGVTMNLRKVHEALSSLVSDKTILVGHGLESDLVALKMIHSTVVDTSLVFPHPRGLPYKRALRHLAKDHLGKIIQSQAGGHDSKEDAKACMELILYKVKQDA